MNTIKDTYTDTQKKIHKVLLYSEFKKKNVRKT